MCLLVSGMPLNVQMTNMAACRVNHRRRIVGVIKPHRTDSGQRFITEAHVQTKVMPSSHAVCLYFISSQSLSHRYLKTAVSKKLGYNNGTSSRCPQHLGSSSAPPAEASAMPSPATSCGARLACPRPFPFFQRRGMRIPELPRRLS